MANPTSPPRRKPRFRERNALPIRPTPAPQPRKAVPPPPPDAARPRVHVRARAIALPRLSTEVALYVAVMTIGFVLRIWDAGSRAMHGDEAVHAWMAWNLYNGTGYHYDPVYHGPLQFPITALFFFLFGPSNLSGRLMAILVGTALIGMPFFLRRHMGRPAALLASAIIAISPTFVYVSRLERDDVFSATFGLAMAIGIFGYVHTRRPGFLYLLGASSALSLSAMENTYITFFIFGTYLGIVLLTEFLSRRPVGQRLREVWARTGTANLVHTSVVLGALGAIVLAFLLTVFTGLYIPVPLVLVVVIVALVHRQALGDTDPSRSGPHLDAVRKTHRNSWVNMTTIILAILFLAYSTFGTNLTGIWDAGQSFFNSGAACAGNSFPLNPCRRDIIGGLFYWLSQHKVARGGQPWYYYPLLYGLYEQLIVVFGIGGIIWFWRRPTLFTSFLTYWAIWAFGIYSWAGEKFPWLMIHPLIPFTFLAAMFIVDMVRRPGVVRYVVIACAGLLALFEIHSMYEVNYVNGADPVEMMVYVQSSPDTPKVAQSILDVSNKVTNGNTLHATIDSEETWPFAWYLRDMPYIAYPSSSQISTKAFSTNPVIIVDESHQPALLPQLAHKYTGHRYILRWWFPEDGYKALSWSSFFRDAVNPGYWNVIGQWLFERRPFGPKGQVQFYYYVKNGLASPY